MHYVDIHTHHTPHQASSGADSYACIVNLIIATEGQQLPNTPNENGIYYSAGIHPWYISDPDRQMELLRHTCNLPGIVALGEAGLDKRCDTPFDLQVEAFQAIALLASRHRLPLLIHAVKSSEELIALKKRMKPENAWIIHGFRGKKELAESLVRQGFYLSFGEKYQAEALQAVPADRLLLETDESICPIEELYRRAARQRNIGVEQLVSEIQETTGLLFFNQ